MKHPPFVRTLQVTTVVMPFVELLEPPPFAVGWCRIRMHDLTIEIPEVLRPEWEFVIYFWVVASLKFNTPPPKFNMEPENKSLEKESQTWGG